MGIARTLRRAALALALLVGPRAGTAHVDAGEPVADVELATLDGGRHRLLQPGRLSVLVFFRPGHDRSLDTLQRLAECEKALAAKPVHLVGVVSGGAPRDEVRALVRETGVASPVLLDEGDLLYGRLELRQHPVIVIVDRQDRVAAVEPYQRLRYCDIVQARIGFLLGELRQAELDAVLKPPRAAFPGEVSGGHASHYVNLGRKELAKGNCALAVRAFDKALERDPGNAAAREGKERCAGGTVAPAPPAAPAAERR